jgi:hypothetical protein
MARALTPGAAARRAITAPMPSRVVHHADGIAWLRQAALGPEHALVTSLPDSSELKLSFEAWQGWFSEAAALVCAAAAPAAVAIFFQTDVKREGLWVDKAFLLQLAARQTGAQLLWHKVVCRAPAGVVTRGRPGYAHLLCFSRELRLDPKRASADVLPALGKMPWPRAMGVDACQAVAGFLLEHTACRTVVDPFCGVGTMLAVANARGLDAVGVELSPKRAERARTLTL